jgi:hypothetical protein
MWRIIWDPFLCLQLILKLKKKVLVFDFGYASEAEQNSFLLSVVALVGSWLRWQT